MSALHESQCSRPYWHPAQGGRDSRSHKHRLRGLLSGQVVINPVQLSKMTRDRARMLLAEMASLRVLVLGGFALSRL